MTWAHFTDPEDGQALAVSPRLQLVVVDLGEGRCRVLPIRAEDPEGGAEVAGSLPDVCQRLEQAWAAPDRESDELQAVRALVFELQALREAVTWLRVGS